MLLLLPSCSSGTDSSEEKSPSYFPRDAYLYEIKKNASNCAIDYLTPDHEPAYWQSKRFSESDKYSWIKYNGIYDYYDFRLKDDDDYVFINRNYQMRPNVLFYDRISNNEMFYNKKVIEMSIIDGFSIFDWCKVLEKASEIHMIETSLNYVLESDEMKNKITKNINLYHRQNYFNEVDYLFKLNWNYIRL